MGTNANGTPKGIELPSSMDDYDALPPVVRRAVQNAAGEANCAALRTLLKRGVPQSKVVAMLAERCRGEYGVAYGP